MKPALRGGRASPNSKALWKRLRYALRLIAHDNLAPARAFSLARLPLIDNNPRIAALIARAEAVSQRNLLADVRDAGKDSLKLEYQWQPVAPSQSQPLVVTPSGTVDTAASAPVRARAFPKPGDWRAAAFILERRFPNEFGAAQPAQVANTVIEVLTALSALRNQPASLSSLRHVPQLPAPTNTVEDARTHAHAREGE